MIYPRPPMANEEHLAVLKQGTTVWNRWREENPAIEPVLYRAILIRVYLRVFGPVGPVSENPELLVIPGFRDGTLGLWTTRTALSIHVWSLFDRSAQPGP